MIDAEMYGIPPKSELLRAAACIFARHPILRVVHRAHMQLTSPESLHVLYINCIITYHSRSFLILTSSRSLSPIFCFENASSIFHAALSEYWHKKTCFLICILLKITLRLFSSFELWCCHFVHQLATFPCVWRWPGRRLAYKGWPVRTCALSLYYAWPMFVLCVQLNKARYDVEVTH